MIAEYKVRVSDMEWGDTPVIAEFAVDNDEYYKHATAQADTHAVKIANAVEREVRWNWQGSLQGNYIRPMR